MSYKTENKNKYAELLTITSNRGLNARIDSKISRGQQLYFRITNCENVCFIHDILRNRLEFFITCNFEMHSWR